MMPLKKPRLLNLAAGVSLLLAIAIILLWAQSQFRQDGVSYTYDRFEPNGTRVIDVAALSSDGRMLDLSYYRDLLPSSAREPAGGYFSRPNDSGGRPKFSFGAAHYSDASIWRLNEYHQRFAGWGPVRWEIAWPRVKHGPDRESYLTIAISHWLLAVVFAILPAIALVRHRRRRRRETNNLCPTCGYDLRATPDRCPECGTWNPRAV